MRRMYFCDRDQDSKPTWCGAWVCKWLRVPTRRERVRYFFSRLAGHVERLIGGDWLDWYTRTM